MYNPSISRSAFLLAVAAIAVVPISQTRAAESVTGQEAQACLQKAESELGNTKAMEEDYLNEARFLEGRIVSETEKLNQIVQQRKDSVPYSWNLTARREAGEIDQALSLNQEAQELLVRTSILEKNMAYDMKIETRTVIEDRKRTLELIREAIRWQAGSDSASSPRLSALKAEISKNWPSSTDQVAQRVLRMMKGLGCHAYTYGLFTTFVGAQSSVDYKSHENRELAAFNRSMRSSLDQTRQSIAETQQLIREVQARNAETDNLIQRIKTAGAH